jgi:uncharacterized membrane protein YfcA
MAHLCAIISRWKVCDPMNVISELLLLVTGLLAGTVGGMLGLGGGIVLMPVLRFHVGLPPPLAAGTCIVGVFCTTLAGSIRHYRLGHIHLRSLLPVVVSGAIATVLFSLLFVAVARRGHWLDFGMGLVFLAVAVRMIQAGLRRRGTREDIDAERTEVRGALWKKTTIGTSAGVLPGLLGIGTGAILVPAFTMVLKAPMKVAVGSSLACFMINALVSSGFKGAQGFVDWSVAVPICAGAVIGSTLGAQLNRRFPSSSLKVLFGAVFLYVAAKFILSTWGINL